MQALYGAAYHRHSDGTVKQYYGNLDAVADDFEEAIKAAGLLNAKNFGDNNEFLLNSDIKNYSVTTKDLEKFQ